MAGVAHTPGPWRAEDTNGAKLSKVVVSARAGANGSTVVIGACNGPDKEANARLIAASPDMLAALKSMIAEWEKFTRYGSPIAKAANESVNAARAAIAKVEAGL